MVEKSMQKCSLVRMAVIADHCLTKNNGYDFILHINIHIGENVTPLCL